MKSSSKDFNQRQENVFFRFAIAISCVGAAALTCTLLFSGESEVFKSLAGMVSQPSKTPKKGSAESRELVLKEASNKSNHVENEPHIVLNDSAFSQAWGLKKSEAARAWELSQGSSQIVVAVIDTGADLNHEDLQVNLWSNPGEMGLDSKGLNRGTNGLDDDGNGFVDDVHGWNFVSNNKDLTDNHGHGTHIAGIIGAEAGNGKGIAGIAPHVSLMILKYYDPKVPNTDNLRGTVAALKYAVKMKANIINYSGGGTEFSQEEHDAIEEARKAGILVVAAAGNERSNSDHHHYYPADYGLSNIISVTAIDPSTEVLRSSNYGVETVDLAAPGQNILSTLPGNNYGTMTGTSQATAFVSGAAVLVMAHKSITQPEEVKKYILATGDNESSLLSKTRTSRRLNLYKALTIQDQNVAISGIMANMKVAADPSMGSLGSQNKVNEMSQFGHRLAEKLDAKRN